MVRVALQGECGGRVAGEGLQVADGLAALGQERQARMPQIVEADRWKLGPLQHAQGQEQGGQRQDREPHSLPPASPRHGPVCGVVHATSFQ